MNVKKLFSAFLSAIIVFSSFSYYGITELNNSFPVKVVAADIIESGKCGDNVTYNFNSGKLTLSGTGKTYDYPSIDTITPWNDYTADIKEIEVDDGITYIGECIFRQCINMKKLTLPNTLNQIGAKAFSQCKSIECVSLPDSITSINYEAFSYCDKLSEVCLPSGITELSQGLFSECQNLSIVNIPDNVTTIYSSAFYNTKSIKSIQLPEGLKFIYGYAFCGSGISNIVFPDSLIMIESNAFMNCNELSSIFLPKNLKIIGYRTSSQPEGMVFSTNTEVNVSSDNTYFSSENGILFNKDKTLLIHYPSNAKMTEYTIPDSVEEIAMGAFYGSNIEKVIIPEKLRKIGVWAFALCNNLLEIDLPKSVEETGLFSFCECGNLKTIIFRNPECDINSGSINDFSDPFKGTIYGHENSTAQNFAKDNNYNFDLIDNLPLTTTTTLITTTTTTTAIPSLRSFNGKCGENAIWEFDGNYTLTISGTGKMSNYGSAKGPLPWDDVKNRIKKVVIKDGIENIGGSVFHGLANLQSILIPNSVNSIEDYAFGGCTSLKEVVLPENLKKIGCQAFTGLSLSEINIPSSVELIDEGAFANCKNLNEIILNDNNNYITVDGVLYNKEMTSLLAYPPNKNNLEYTVPSSVKRIEGYAYSLCNNLRKISLPSKLEYIGKCAFYNSSNLTEVNLSDCIKTIGDFAFQGCTNLKSINIPNGISVINDRTFCECKNLKEIILPENITEVCFMAFGECTNLADITFLNPDCKIARSRPGDTIPSTVTVHGYKKSSAESFAKFNKNEFVELQSITTTTTTTTTSTATTTKATTTTTTSTSTITNTTTKVTTITTLTTEITSIPMSKNKFENGADNWSFSNSRKNFGDIYYINSEYWNKLLDGLSNKEKEQIKKNVKNTNWNGSCYGMATTSILASYGILEPYNWQSEANFLNDITEPPSSEVKSLINYYYSLQFTDVVEQQIVSNFYNKNEKEKLEYLVSCLKDGSPTLLCYHGYFDRLFWGGHGVVAYDVEYGTYVKNGKAYNGKIITYDNNNIDYNDDYCLYFNSSDGSWTIPHYQLSTSYGSILGLITDDVDLINYHGYINGSTKYKNDKYIAILQSAPIICDYKIVKAMYNSGIWANTTTSDDDIKMFSALTDEDDYQNGSLMFALKDSAASYILNLQKTEQFDLALSYDNSLLNASVSSGSTAKFSPSDCVSIIGKNTDYELGIILNEERKVTDWYSFSVKGSNVNDATLEKVENGYILKATNLKDVTANAFNDDVTAKVTFSTEYPKVFLFEKDEQTIGIAVDTDDNGSFETELEVKISYKFGDINNDGQINAVDASAVLAYYAMISTNKDGNFNEIQKAAADVNDDGQINAVDASNILAYYAYLSTTQDSILSLKEYMKK